MKLTEAMRRALPSIGLLAALAGCDKAADVASRNLSNAADNFEINRRVTFYNGITGTSALVIEGLCSLGNNDPPRRLTVTCKTGPNAFKKHFLGLSDNITFFAEQIEDAPASTYHYRVIFNPTAVIPSLEVR